MATLLAIPLLGCKGQPDNLAVIKNDLKKKVSLACSSKHSKCYKGIEPNATKLIVNSENIYISFDNELYRIRLPQTGVFKLSTSRLSSKDKFLDDEEQCRVLKKNQLFTRIACEAKPLKPTS